MYRIRIKLTGLFLATILIVFSIPITGKAQNIRYSQEEVNTGTVTDGFPISSEVLSLREENTKHFKTGNGTYQAVIYSHPVHELDNNGNWKDIDFSLSPKRNSSISTYANDTIGIEVAASYAANQPLFTLSEGDKSISLSFSPQTIDTSTLASKKEPNAITAKITNPRNNFISAAAALSATFSSKVLYENVLPGITLEYIIDPDIVKENIIVAHKMDSYKFDFTLHLGSLQPSLKADGSISIADCNGTEIYCIPAPFMYDYRGNISEEVHYILSSGSTKGSYQLSVVASTDWINRTERSFPVTIDPSVVKSTGLVQDTYINGAAPNTNYGSIARLWVRSDRVSYICTQTPNVPSYASLDWAKLITFYCFNDDITSGFVDVNLHRVNSGSWSENALTWNSVSSLPNYGLSSENLATIHTDATQGATYNSPKQIDVDITNTTRDWLNGTYPNFGFGLTYDESSPNLSVVFKSSESNYDHRPRIQYQYSFNSYYFTNYYDSSMESETIALIPTAFDFAHDVFLSQFDVYFSTTGSPAYLGTLTDDREEDQHMDIYSISNALQEISTSNYARTVLWTDYPRGTYCNHASGSCVAVDNPLSLESSVIACVVDYSNAIHILNILPDNASSDWNLACMAINLVHETAHTFGLNDRYTCYNHEAPGYQCVMEYYPGSFSAETDPRDFYYDIQLGLRSAFCEHCAEDLNDLVNP